jgi:dethiobiotin synthetase
VNFTRAAAVIDHLAMTGDLVLVEGAGGLLVRYDADGATLPDLAAAVNAPAVVVTTAGLGTLNHTALTLEAMHARKVALAGVVVGAWPADPGLAERENLTDLAALAGGSLAGLLPHGIATLPSASFAAVAQAGLGPELGGGLGGG